MTKMTAEWEKYRNACYDGATSPEAFDHLKQAYFAGALSMMVLTKQIAQSGDKSSRPQLVKALYNEVTEYLDARVEIIKAARESTPKRN